MKIFSSELGTNYDTYTFGYTTYAKREESDPLAALYRKGFLPYSGSPRAADIFYMARSVRVVLADFELTSENRRIAKKFDGEFVRERMAFTDAVFDENAISFCLSYFAQKHGERAMPRERFEHILKMGLVTHLITYKKEKVIVAYVLEVADDTIGHYWFSFYDLAFARQSLGLWLMLDAVQDAQKRKLAYYYLGTVYGEKALYKTNFEPLEWWDGTGWSTDSKLLRQRGRTDAERMVLLTDAWKTNQVLF